MRVALLALFLVGCSSTPDYCVEENWNGRCVAWWIGPTDAQMRNFGNPHVRPFLK